MYDKQLNLEMLYNKNNQIPKLTKMFGELSNDPLVLKLLVQMALHKRMTVSTALGLLVDRSDTTDNLFDDAICTIEQCIEHNYVRFEYAKYTNEPTLIVVFEPTQEEQKQMDLYMYPPPMVTKPNVIKTNAESGYLVTPGTVLSKGAYTPDDVCLDVINKLNSFKFTLDLDVLKFSSETKNLDKPKEGESQFEFRKRKRQWIKFDTDTRQLLADNYSDVGTINLTHYYDYRGRFYCRGYHVTYQGNEWRKALVQFQEELLDD